MQDVFFAFLAIFGSRSPARYDPPADPKAARGTDHALRLRKAQDLLSAAKRSSALRGIVRTKNTSGAADVIRRARGHRRCCRRPRSRPKAGISVRSPLRPKVERGRTKNHWTLTPSMITVRCAASMLFLLAHSLLPVFVPSVLIAKPLTCAFFTVRM